MVIGRAVTVGVRSATDQTTDGIVGEHERFGRGIDRRIVAIVIELDSGEPVSVIPLVNQELAADLVGPFSAVAFVIIFILMRFRFQQPVVGPDVVVVSCGRVLGGTFPVPVGIVSIRLVGESEAGVGVGRRCQLIGVVITVADGVAETGDLIGGGELGETAAVTVFLDFPG